MRLPYKWPGCERREYWEITMPVYEYKVVPAPEKGRKGKGLKGPRERFANALESVMNELGAEGWEYIRADTLPCEERSGLTGSTTTYQNMLVFRREVVRHADEPAYRQRPFMLPAPEAVHAPAPAVPPMSAPAAPPAPGQPPVGEVANTAPSASVTELPAAFNSAPPQPAQRLTAVPQPSSPKDAAAAAAAAALTAYRESTSHAPKLGPAPERHRDRDLSAD